MKQLPTPFTDRMKTMLGEEYNTFAASYHRPCSYGLRVNSLKWHSDMQLPFSLSPIPWAANGYFADRREHPGRHVLHEAGAYYIQEPSAMSVISLLEPQPGELILDLCAAPGGKSTQIASSLNGSGLLVSNEVIVSRAKILSRNMERMGVTNAIVCNETPDTLAMRFIKTFDRIVVDAPCSGEGMFRKDDVAVSEWNPENVIRCASRQREILNTADQMLRDGGTLVYSTCTFSPQEDEEILLWFLRSHPAYTVEAYHRFLSADGLSSGKTDFVSPELLPLSTFERDSILGSLRLWPHKISGEGHFAFRLQKGSSDSRREQSSMRKNSSKKTLRLSGQETSTLQQMLSAICRPACHIAIPFRCLALSGDEINLLPEWTPSLQGLKILRAGLHIATRKKNRFEPAHALAMALHPDDVFQYLELSEADATRYLHGETLACDSQYTGWVLVGHRHCSMGFGKASNGILKNHYPKGLRINF